jgi:hypothetical protein
VAEPIYGSHGNTGCGNRAELNDQRAVLVLLFGRDGISSWARSSASGGFDLLGGGCTKRLLWRGLLGCRTLLRLRRLLLRGLWCVW